MNIIHTRPAGGWAEDTVPTEIGRDYWRWCTFDLAQTKWCVDGVRDLVADFIDDDVERWQYADVRATRAQVLAAISGSPF